MGGLAKSIGGLLGADTGPKAPDGYFTNTPLEGLNGYLTNNPDQQATGATTGSNFATDQVSNNKMLAGGLQGMNGQLQAGQGLQAGQTDKLNQLQNQGFNLTPEDQTQYGQESGNIARQFGQAGNQTANSLAQRGLSSSGAAGAAFSGLAGNQNEMLSQAQQQIAQQRFQNTMGQIGQQQQFLGQLNAQNNQAAGNVAGQGANEIGQQYGRQLAGAQNQVQGLATGAGLTQNANNSQNSYGLQKAGFDAANQPANLVDMAAGGLSTAMGAAGKSAGQKAGNAGGGNLISTGLGLFGL